VNESIHLQKLRKKKRKFNPRRYIEKIIRRKQKLEIEMQT
jgi:hypothetical protein